MVEISKDGELNFSVESDGDFVEVDIDDGTVNLTLPNDGAEKFGEALLAESEKTAESE